MHVRPVILCLYVCVSVSFASIIHVPGDQPTIQAALNAAAPGDEIVLAPATYDISAGLSFFDDNITIRSASGNALNTVLDAHNAASPITITARSGIVFRDVTLTRANTAVRLHLTSALFDACRFWRNASTSTSGFGALLATSSDVTLIDCAFEENIARYPTGGAAISAYAGHLTLLGSRFIANNIPEGTAAPTSAGAGVFLGVLLDVGGSGQYVGTNLVATDCVFVGNQADLGGAISAGGANAHIDRCRFAGNQSTLGGAVLLRDLNLNGQPVECHAAITNSTFSANIATRFMDSLNGLGGAVAAADGADLDAVNNSFWLNSAQSSGGAILVAGATTTVLVGNALLADSTPNNFFSTGSLSVSSNLSGSAAALGLSDPVGPDAVPGTEDDNLSLLAGSPAIDAGNNSIVPPGIVLDADRVSRFRDDPATADNGVGSAPIVDIGAFEFQPAGPCNDADFAVPYGTLNFFDVQAFLGLFAAHDPLADLVADGQFNFFDVQAFLNAFSRGC